MVVATVALLLGILGDALLRPGPSGLGAALWLVAVVAAVLAVARRAEVADLAGPHALLLAPVLLAAAGLAWRDSAVLKALDLLVILLALGWVAVGSRPAGPTLADPSTPLRRGLGNRPPKRRSHRFRRPGATDYALAALTAGWETAAGAVPLLAAEIGWRDRFRTGGPAAAAWRGHALAAGRGLLLAAPALLLFGALLAAADAFFADLLRRAFVPDLGATVSHLLIVLLLAWFAAGLLRALAANAPAPRWVTAPPGPLRVGEVEVGVLLGSLDALFLLFVAVQARYLFGGAARVDASATLTYADYARRGFFELVAVAALALPLLLVVDWLLRRPPAADATAATTDRATILFRSLAGLHLLLLAVVLASALQRMRLYHGQYGLTELRVYTTACMLWLALLLPWFAATVLRGRRPAFAAGALLAAALVLAGLHVLNPDALIVRANAARAADPGGRPFDATYAVSLSADAVPALLDAWPHVPLEDRCLVVSRLRADHLDRPEEWRTQSWSRWVAGRAVRAGRANLAPCPPRTDSIPPSDAGSGPLPEDATDPTLPDGATR